MCTVSFVPAEDGYLIGMNRDELLRRAPALPPQVFERDGTRVLYPRESSGGTWIGCNPHGNLLALLNLNDKEQGPSAEKRKSRGIVIPELLGEAGASKTSRRLDRMDLQDLFPFRLIGIFAAENSVREWRWNGESLHEIKGEWVRNHWFSSSLSDRLAERERGAVCAAAWNEPDAGSEKWMRALHRSHVPGPGPFSICVHRPDAATVSYVEVLCHADLITMHYLAGSPCQEKEFDRTASLPLRRRDNRAAGV